MTKRGEPLPINQAMSRSRAKLGLELSTWMVIAFVSIAVFLVGFRAVAVLTFQRLRSVHGSSTASTRRCSNSGATASARRVTMTRAKTEQQKHTPWFAKAGTAASIVPLSRAFGPNVFALKGGGYAVLFSVDGDDDESLTDQELEAKVRGLESALRGLTEGSRSISTPASSPATNYRASPSTAIRSRNTSCPTD